nr:GNAT family N-acetyltransferase [Maliibacterium massiliense]
MQIRKTTMDDLPDVMALFAAARAFMRAHGNPHQWGTHHPTRALIAQDIAQGKSYVCTHQGVIVGTFYFAVEEEPTYARIAQGAWLCDAPYGVVHRIAAVQGTRGVASFCLTWAFARCGNVRIDTHRDNLPMQGALAKNGFVRCGVIHLADGAERIAYQRCR